MLNSYIKINLPSELSALLIKKPEDIAIDEYQIINSDVEIKCDSRGRVISACYYTPEGETLKQIFFDGNHISKINYYRDEKLYSAEYYKNSLILAKEIYMKDGELYSVINYEYNKNNQICRITKKTIKNEIVCIYKFDSLNRIISRKILIDSKPYSEQQYEYDILDRIVEYRDENYKIRVKNMSFKNELLCYEITDKIGNKISITNHFTELGYENSNISLNGCSISVNDTSYTDNIMLKKPYTSEDDLDFIIANLFKNANNTIKNCEHKKEATNKSSGFVDKNIELRSLPISIRKRVLYNLVTGE